MRNTKIFKAMAVAAPILLSASAMAVVVTATVNFKTVQDVSVTEDTQPNFGETIIPIAGRSCTMTPDIATSSATAPTYAAIEAPLSGTACDNAAIDAEAGGYAITGAANSQILITLGGQLTATDWTYAPIGAFQDGASSTPVTTAGVATVTLSGAGTGYLSMGGTLTIVNDLTFNIAYTDTYAMEITY
jgi:hypothetical protein